MNHAYIIYLIEFYSSEYEFRGHKEVVATCKNYEAAITFINDNYSQLELCDNQFHYDSIYCKEKNFIYLEKVLLLD